MPLKLSFIVDTAKATLGVKKFNRNFKRTETTAEKVGKSIRFATKGIAVAGTAMVGAGVAALAFTKKQAEVIDKTAKMAQSIGFTTKGVTELQHAFSIGGVSAEEFQKAMVKGTKSLADAGSGLSTQKRAFGELSKVLGTDLINSGKSLEQLMPQIADGLNKIEDPAKKAQVAMDIFGRSGAKMVTALSGGSEELKKLTEEADNLGISFDNVAAKNAADFNDAMTRLGGIATGVFRSMAVDLMPKITEAMDSITKAISENENVFSELGNIITKSLVPVQWALDFIKKDIDTISDNLARMRAEEENARNNKKADLLIAEKEYTILQKKNIIQKGLSTEEIKSMAQKTKLIAHLRDELNLSGKERKIFALRGQMATFQDKKQKDFLQNKINGIQAEINAERKLAEVKKKPIIQAKVKQVAKKSVSSESKKTNDFLENRIEHEKAAAERIAKIKDEASDAEWQNFQDNMDKEFALRDESFQKELDQANAIEADREAKHQKELARRQELIQNITTGLSNASQTFSNFTQAEVNGINQKAEQEKARAQEIAELRLQQAHGNAKQEEAIRGRLADREKAIEAKRAKDERAAMKKTAIIRKSLAITESIINTAVEATKVLHNPFLFASTIALGASQTALIASQSFAKGGFPEGKDSLVRVNENGQEAVLNASATAFLGKNAINALNGGRSDSVLQQIAENTGSQSSKTIQLNINGGIIDERFAEDSLIPMIEQAMARR